MEPHVERFDEPTVSAVVDSRRRSIGNLDVRRLLPSSKQRTLGPFVYMDHMGPHDLGGSGPVDVPQHPHIDLATVTYLFQGELTHRDSTGVKNVIRPGEINWMTAGRGVVHSERVPRENLRHGEKIHGMQVWLGLPKEVEGREPFFRHYGRESFHAEQGDDFQLLVLMGRYKSVTSPVNTHSPTLYCDLRMEAGSTIEIPDEYSERGVYIAQGRVDCGGHGGREGQLLVLKPGETVEMKAEEDTRAVLLGGEPLDGERFIWWNFVSSKKQRIEQAARDWQEGRFAPVENDIQDSLKMPPMRFPWDFPKLRDD